MPNLINAILPLFLIFAVKILENMLDATKILMLQKGKHVISGVVLIMAVIINYTIMKKIVSSGTEVMIVAAVGAGAGYMLAGILGERFMRSSHIEIIMSDDKEVIIEIHKFLTEKHIRHKIEDTYNKDLTKKTLTITALPDTPAKHKMITKFINESSLHLRHVVVQ